MKRSSSPSLVKPGLSKRHKNNYSSNKNRSHAIVDKFCTEKMGVAHVYYEDEMAYDALLNQTNLQHNNNKYYVMQLLEDDSSPHYSVWFRWGRVGKPGQHKLESFGSNLEMAKSCFHKKFLDKTGNIWDPLAIFTKVDGKYDVVKVHYGEENGIQEVEKPARNEVKSLLPESVQLLLGLIYDVKAMEAELTELSYDSRRAPLGKLTKEQVAAGYAALRRISDCINQLQSEANSHLDSSVRKRGRPRRSSASTIDKKTLEHELLQACNLFYTRIPHDFGMRIPPLIRTPKDLKEKLELLAILDDVEYAVSSLNENKSSKENLLDTKYKQLNCDLKPMDPTNPMFMVLCNYLHTNHGNTHNWYTLELLDIHECTKPSEVEGFTNHGNRMLLWHGSRLTNWVGILGRGLKVAPPEAPVTGYMFGKGIYFADCSSKSANYSYPTQKKNVGVLALCEVSVISPFIASMCCELRPHDWWSVSYGCALI
ncbi:unnamed protein product [Dicrocoelium dendriticum]|nr:unnamed protein product [Dicrocoelium dendriticum]